MNSRSPSPPPLLCLASASPRRRELLAQIHVAHCVRAAGIDERRHPGEAARDYVVRLARAKALAVWRADGTLPVLGADTVVVLDGVLYGKPGDRDEALRILAALSGRTHEVLTAVALASAAGVDVRVSATAVRMRATSAAERAAYWECGEPRDKAGAYAIQGRGALFIESISGSYSGVMGLPLYETAQLLSAAGVEVLAAR